MNAEIEQLPFEPPTEGCQIEHIQHVGPFITRVEMRLPDGRPWEWTSRQHRHLGGIRSIGQRSTGDDSTLHWWIRVGILARVGWCISALFMLGSLCFALASVVGILPLLSVHADLTPNTINTVFFVGSIFFTAAAYLQYLAAVNAGRISAIAHRRQMTQPYKWFAFPPHGIGGIAAFTQFVGTLLFNLNTVDVFITDLDWLQEDLLIWTPDVVGSVCFLVASALAGLEYGHGRWIWRADDVSSWVVNINMLGSICFGVSAIYAFVLPVSGELVDAWAVNLWTLLGALCFLAGAYLLLPELRRNLRSLVGVPGVSE